MQCAQCGNDLADDMRFCANCGRARDGQIAKPTVVMTKALKDATAYGSGLITDIRGLPFNTLFPFRSWAQSKIWSGTIVRAILFFALTPLVLSYYFGQDVSVKQAAWALGVYFALVWGWVVFSIARPPCVHVHYIVGIGLFTAIIGIPVDLIVQRLPIISTLYSATDYGGVGSLFGFVFGVGVLEETVKLLPILYLAYKIRVLTTPRETAFYAAMSGLAFGVAEAVSYSLGYADQTVVGLMNGTSGEGSYLVSEFLRLISLPFLHCVFTGAAGYFVGLGLVSPKRRVPLVITGLALAALLHGFYDTLSSTWLALVPAAAAVLIFVGYLSNAEALSQQLEEPAVPTEIPSTVTTP